MWDRPGPGLEPMSPALAGGFLTTAPPGKSHVFICLHIYCLLPPALPQSGRLAPWQLGFPLYFISASSPLPSIHSIFHQVLSAGRLCTRLGKQQRTGPVPACSIPDIILRCLLWKPPVRLGPLFPPAASPLRRRVRCRRTPAAPPSAEPQRPPAEKTDLHIQRMLDPGQFQGKEVRNGLETTGQDNSQPLKDSRWPVRCYSKINTLWAQNSTPCQSPSACHTLWCDTFPSVLCPSQTGLRGCGISLPSSHGLIQATSISLLPSWPLAAHSSCWEPDQVSLLQNGTLLITPLAKERKRERERERERKEGRKEGREGGREGRREEGRKKEWNTVGLTRA